MSLGNELEVYCVGGAVRDELLGLPVKDKDYVVVGGSAEKMVNLGYRPVGKDFPVFLHPETRDEYALARTERKTGKGYKGFIVHSTPEVSLEEDLSRRDFTINAIAKSANGDLIDFNNGLTDIKNKVIRHVSNAFVEDPVRILRAARFLARFTNFSIASETMTLMKQMVANGEVDSLVSERVWQEISTGLMEIQPSRMFEALRACGALKILLPELDRLWGVPQPAQHHPEIDTGVHVMMVIDYAAKNDFSLAVRYAALMHDLGKGTTQADMLPRHTGHEQRSLNLVKQVSQRLRAPNEPKELAQIVAKCHGKLHQAMHMKPATMLHFLMELDAIRQPTRFDLFLKACEADSRGRTGLEKTPLPELALMRNMLEVVMTVNAGAVAKQHEQPEQIKKAIFEARLGAIKKAMKL